MRPDPLATQFSMLILQMQGALTRPGLADPEIGASRASLVGASQWQLALRYFFVETGTLVHHFVIVTAMVLLPGTVLWVVECNERCVVCLLWCNSAAAQNNYLKSAGVSRHGRCRAYPLSGQAARRGRCRVHPLSGQAVWASREHSAMNTADRFGVRLHLLWSVVGRARHSEIQQSRHVTHASLAQTSSLLEIEMPEDIERRHNGEPGFFRAPSNFARSQLFSRWAPRPVCDSHCVDFSAGEEEDIFEAKGQQPRAWLTEGPRCRDRCSKLLVWHVVWLASSWVTEIGQHQRFGVAFQLSVRTSSSQSLVESWRAPSTVDVLTRPPETQSRLPTPVVNATSCRARVNQCTA